MKFLTDLFRLEILKRWCRAVQLTHRSALGCVIAGLLTAFTPAALAQSTVSLAQIPLLALKSAPGLVMMTMSRDQRLFYAAYNDSSDLNGDGVLDVGFKPGITYYGYFASDRCYAYDTTNSRFSPKSVAGSTTGCNLAPSKARWHGNWLNWATMSRMDALRRVLYGGHRVSDPATNASPTVLQGSFIPRDAHVWGKEYRPVSGRDLGVYLIQNYTPLAAPNAGKQHLFIVKSDNFTAPSDTGSTVYPFPMPTPNLRVITNADQVTQRIWNWAAGDGAALGQDDPGYGDGASTPYAVKVEVCIALSGVRETGCTGYPSGTSPVVWKPTGTLHDYAVGDGLKFGLLTGSYQNNYSGGVVRRNIASFNDEVTPATGQWRKVTEGAASVDGIAVAIDRLSIYGWNGSGGYYCGASFTAGRNQGVCPSWGAPVSEMMYEGLRYFSGKAAPTSAFFDGLSNSSSADSRLSLPLMGTSTSPWANPYRAKSSGGNPICSKPVQMVIADPVTSYDSDQLPGAYSGFPLIGGSAAVSSSDLTGWGSSNLSTDSNLLWTLEGLGTRNIYIGQSGGLADGNPTAKSASSFFSIRGHAPDGAQAQGGFYAAPVARFGRTPGINIGAPSATPAVPLVSGQAVDTIAVALGSVVPRILIPSDVNRTRIATLVPIAKSVANLSIDKTPGAYQATGTISGFYLDYSFNTTGVAGPDYNATVNGGRPIMSFAVNFSDSDEGTDNESDAIVSYTVSVVAGGNLVVQITPVQTNIAGIQMQVGYSMSGTTKDGLYLDMRTQASSTVYYLDTLITPTLQDPAPNSAPFRTNATALPATATARTLTFDTSASPSAGFMPQDPLWYAAKYGGAGVLDANGDPTNYFRVTNPSNLPSQMGKAFRSASALAAVSSTSVVGVQRGSGSAAVYQANYDSLTWSSRIYAFAVLATGAVSNTPIWESSSLVTAPAARTTLFLGRGGTTTPFALTSGNYASLSALGSPSEQTDFGSADIYEYILGDKSKEERKGGLGATLRNRGTTSGSEYGSVIGDIVNSDPQVIAKKDYGYTAGDGTYATFLASLTKESLVVGANDGFLHIFDATASAAGGVELFGFMPQAARLNIKDLASTSYSHRYFIDGSIGLGHAKIPVPGDTTANWRTILVGTGGSGAKTVFAINAPNSQAYSANSVLWEINGNTTLPTTGSLGNSIGRPAIGKLKNGTWVAVFGNGYNSTAGEASLFVVNLATGAIIKQISTAAIGGNGLGDTEIVKSTTGTQDTIDYVYAADYKGNIWRFDISASSDASWPASAARLYTTPTGRPITAEIMVGPAVGGTLPAGGKMVYFGTGSFLNLADTTTTSPNQALYGIYDDLLWTSNLTAGVAETTLNAMTITMPTAASDKRTTSPTGTPWFNTAGKKGWVLPLTGTNVAAGERVIAPPVRFTVTGVVDAVFFTSIVPGTDECKSSIDTWVTGVDAMTGGYAKPFEDNPENSIKVVGGSPRGVFVLNDSTSPTLYISQTIFNNTINTTTYNTTTGGAASVTINGVVGKTQILGVGLRKAVLGASSGTTKRQIWRQLK